MRSGTNCIINSGRVHSWSLGLLLDAKLVKDHGWKCTAAIVLSITLRAAARCISVSAACRALARFLPPRQSTRRGSGWEGLNRLGGVNRIAKLNGNAAGLPSVN
jgi:hypothetical protein